MAQSAKAPQTCAMSDNPVTRDNMYQFLVRGIEKMQSEETRKYLREKERPGQEMIKIQRGGWEEFGVDQDVGCKQLDKLEELCPGDEEIKQKRNEFVVAAQRAYIRTIEDRKPATLEKKKKIPRDTIIEFFDICNTRMDLPEMHQTLVECIKEKKGMPNQIIIEMQRDMLEVLGFEREHGCAMLSNIGTDFPSDKELHQRFRMWQQRAQMGCQMAMKAAGASMMPNVQNPFEGDPDLEELMPKAKEAVQKLTPAERGKFMTDLQHKMKGIMTMEPAARKEHMRNLPKDEKFEFIKFQVLAFSAMQQHMQQGQEGYSGQQGSPPPYPGQTVSTPAQQEMM